MFGALRFTVLEYSRPSFLPSGGGKAINVGRFYFACTSGTERIEAQVVGKEEEYTRSLFHKCHSVYRESKSTKPQSVSLLSRRAPSPREPRHKPFAVSST